MPKSCRNVALDLNRELIENFPKMPKGCLLFFGVLGSAPTLLAFSLGPISAESSPSEESALESKLSLLTSAILLSAFALECEPRGAGYKNDVYPGLAADLFDFMSPRQSPSICLFLFLNISCGVVATTKSGSKCTNGQILLLYITSW